VKSYDLSFWGFCWKKEQANFASEDEARFLQRSGRGKLGNSFDALDLNEWVDQTGEGPRRARNSRDSSSNR